MSRHRAKCAIIIAFAVSLYPESVDARAADLPTKFSLDTARESFGHLSRESPTKWEQGMELIGRVGDALRFGRGRLVNSAVMARNVIVDRAEGVASEARSNVAAVTAAKGDILAQGSDAINSFVGAAPPGSFSTRETARLESEAGQALLERRKPHPIGTFFETLLKPSPLVDTIREEDKYGNAGDKFIGIGRALVGGFEGLSNFLNALVDFPIDSAKKTSRGVTEALNQLGGRLVGLQ